MTERYDNSAAWHYAAYRPPLHSLILERILQSGESFQAGLDVGCGTGYSAIALSRYCDHVFGVDSSRAMLDSAQTHAKVTYIHGELDLHIQLPAQRLDIVSFAGSLFYTKSDTLRNALTKFCSPGGTVVVYDFGVLLHEVLTTLGVDCLSHTTDYDCTVNLSDWEEYTMEISNTERLALDASEKQVAHLLLADSNHYDALEERFPDGDLFESIVTHLRKRPEKCEVYSDIYFTRHRMKGN